MALLSRAQLRKELDVPNHLLLLDNDLDEVLSSIQALHDECVRLDTNTNARISRLMTVAATLLVTTSTSIVLLVLNLVVNR